MQDDQNGRLQIRGQVAQQASDVTKTLRARSADRDKEVGGGVWF
ncbi:MAG: hypothetical protein WA702_10275 [Bradyrhizobium sp.]